MLLGWWATLWKTPGGREGATPPGHHLWGRPLPPRLPQESPFLGFLYPGIQLSEMGAPSFSDAESWLPLPPSSSCPHPQCRHHLLCLVDAHFFSRCCPQPLSSLSLRPLPLKGEAFSVRSALICVLLGSPCAGSGCLQVDPVLLYLVGPRVSTQLLPTEGPVALPGASLIALQTLIYIPISGPGQDPSCSSHSLHLS